MIFTLVIWLSCFFSWTKLFFITESSSYKDKCIVLISFLIICILIIIKLALYDIKKKCKKKSMLDSAIPFLHYIYLICQSNIIYGYGNTMGILGYSKIIGLFSIINISYNIAFVLISIIYAILWLTMILNYNMNTKANLLPKNIVTFFAVIIGMAVELIGISKFIVFKELSRFYTFSIALFWIFVLINYLKSKIISLNN